MEVNFRLTRRLGVGDMGNDQDGDEDCCPKRCNDSFLHIICSESMDQGKTDPNYMDMIAQYIICKLRKLV